VGRIDKAVRIEDTQIIEMEMDMTQVTAEAFHRIDDEASVSHFVAWSNFSNESDARTFAARFPKTLGLNVRRLYGAGPEPTYTVTLRVNFVQNKVQKRPP
jgi:hypothetical protein